MSQEKIRSEHLERAAYVYVRQSSMQQVVDHRESTRRQYGLADYARELGFSEVVVVDEDQGKSSAGRQERLGFGRLLEGVCKGVVGGVLALEGSRLARNNRDWHHLVDLCALTGTLLIDYDGIYDPRILNDRLLLGLKGTMAEFELGIMRQRAREAFMDMVRRGEVLWEVPAGYVRTDDNRCEMTPDREIQGAIRSFFSRFQKVGSARQILRFYNHNRVTLPGIERGTRGQKVTWNVPTFNVIIAMLKNPIYAGAFVWGRRRYKSEVRGDGKRRLKRVDMKPENWEVLIRDHHPGYISWEEYEQNQKQLADNRATSRAGGGRGATKRGPALLAGLIRCRRCGYRLQVHYGGTGGRVIRYECRGELVRRAGPLCTSFGGRRVEQAVVAQVLEALRPIGVQAALEAWDKLGQEDEEKVRALELAVERAEYEAERARRQYDRVEPENRLVAAELEKRWDEALEKHRDLVAQLQQTRRRTMPERLVGGAERQRLLELGEDLPRLWTGPGASVELKKRLLRTVLEEIIADVDEDLDPPQIRLSLHWAGGTHTELSVRKNRTGERSNTTDRDVVDLVAELSQACCDRSIAAILNRLGYRTGNGNGWTKTRVGSLRAYRRIPAFDQENERDWVNLNEAAEYLRVDVSVVRRLLREGVLPGRQIVKHAPWIIDRVSLELPAVSAAVLVARRRRRGPRCTDQDEALSLFPTT